MVRPRQRPPRA